MNISSWHWICVLTLLFMSVLSGCAAVQPFPMQARGGDTISLAVGSPEGMTKANTTLAFYSDANPTVPIDLTNGLSQIVKIYPDKSSYAWQMSLAGATALRSGHGPWLTLLIVNLPKNLPVGTGKIMVTAGAGVTYPRFNPNINGVAIAMEVLPGTGSPNPFNYANYFGGVETGHLSWLTPGPQVVIKPPVPDETEARRYGAIQITANVPIQSQDGSPIDPAGIRVILDDQPGNGVSQIQYNWYRNGDQITVMLVSPAGMSYYEARLSIVLLYPDYPYSFSGTPTLTSITYYDLNGNLATGPTPTIAVAQN